MNKLQLRALDAGTVPLILLGTVLALIAAIAIAAWPTSVAHAAVPTSVNVIIDDSDDKIDVSFGGESVEVFVDLDDGDDPPADGRTDETTVFLRTDVGLWANNGTQIQTVNVCHRRRVGCRCPLLTSMTRTSTSRIAEKAIVSANDADREEGDETTDDAPTPTPMRPPTTAAATQAVWVWLAASCLSGKARPTAPTASPRWNPMGWVAMRSSPWFLTPRASRWAP